jgi:serine/threonine protein kinase
MEETISALDELGYDTLDMLRGDEELTPNHLMKLGSVKEFIAYTLCVNLKKERHVIPSPSPLKSDYPSSFFVEGKPITINEEKSNLVAGIFFGAFMIGLRSENVVVKLMNEDRDLNHEFNILRDLNTQGFSSCLHALHLSVDSGLSYLVLEDFGVNLTEMMKNRPLAIRKIMASEILDAVASLHRYGVMHGDIKPENILCRNDSMKLCDFDSARQVGKDFPRRRDGCLKYTSAWVSPEVFLADYQGAKEREGYKGGSMSLKASLSIDVFSVGLLVEVLYRHSCSAYSTANNE